jgi:hypothetical protein
MIRMRRLSDRFAKIRAQQVAADGSSPDDGTNYDGETHDEHAEP